jgi:putative transcriptional regulator
VNNSRLTVARIAKGYSQAELAKLADVSRQTVNAIESGDYNPTLKLCVRIAKCLDTTLDKLFWEE